MRLGLLRSCALTLLASLAAAGERVPAEHWLRYADPADAGFDPAKLEEARQSWESLPSSAFLVIADGAVVAAWGDTERRFMCHSVRKSFLAALYGIYWDRGELELNKTLADLEIDDEPDPLLETERRARILDLLKARSGVFHPAAYAGRTDSRPRGSEGPGRYFAYNNWDFNTLATILMQETGEDVFEAFDRYFARPLGMQDWRLSDGYYHYERDKSKYPAYPFRMSARDAARFGLLFTRLGSWGDQRILSKHWVDRCTALYSIDSPVMGYGFMWWVLREPQLQEHGMVAALGVGNQMIAALPESDLVIVNRANTWDQESTPTPALLALVKQVLDARTGTPSAEPQLLPLESGPQDPRHTNVSPEELAAFVGAWPQPPEPFGGESQGTLKLSVEGGHLVSLNARGETFRLYVQPNGTLHQEDSRRTLYVLRDADSVAGVASVSQLLDAAVTAAGRGEIDQAESWLALAHDAPGSSVPVVRAYLATLRGALEEAEALMLACVEQAGATEVEARVNFAGYELLQDDDAGGALLMFELNTRLFPEAANVWDSLGECHMNLGNDERAIEAYSRSLELDPSNTNAEAMIAKIREGSAN